MLPDTAASKVTAAHLSRRALLYIRQSSLKQVLHNTESAIRQYDLRGKAISLPRQSPAVTSQPTPNAISPPSAGQQKPAKPISLVSADALTGDAPALIASRSHAVTP